MQASDTGFPICNPGFPNFTAVQVFLLLLLSAAALIFQSTEDICIKNTESNSLMFVSLREI